jgi:hypothetical protein
MSTKTAKPGDKKRKSRRATEGLGTVFLASAIASSVSAQEAPGDVAILDSEVLPDGSLRLKLSDGRTIEVPGAAYRIGDGQIVIDPAVLIEDDDGSGYIALLGLAALGLAVVAGSSGSADGGDDAPNEPPTFTSNAAFDYAENGTGTVFTAVVTDVDGGAPTFSLSGTDAGLFGIDADSGVVTFNTAPNFEMPGDAADGSGAGAGDNVYNIVVTANDGVNETDQAVAITVTDVNDAAPVFTSGATASFAENGTGTVYTAAVTDVDGGTPEFSLSGTDAALFDINATTGAVTFVAAPDFETPGDAGGDNVYNIVVTANDGENETDQAVAITVTDVNDVAPVFTSGATASFAENGTGTVYTAAVTDVDGGAPTFSLTGPDADLFAIDETTGVVTFVSAPDFETPGDAGGDNVYNITVTASDGENATDQAVAITVTDVNDLAPVFTSGATASFAENGTGTVYTAAVTDVDGGAPTFSLSGADAALFDINATTGAVTFVAAPDFETPGDAGGDNVYNIVVTANDGVNETDQAVAVTVTDEAELPYVVELSEIEAGSTAGFAINGVDVSDQSGVSVSSAGDVNGDGFDDIIVGAYLADPNGTSAAGTSYVIYGGATGANVALSAIEAGSTAGFAINGVDVSDLSGRSVSSAGDVNGDGFDDIIVGAFFADPNGTSDAGTSYVIYGGATGANLELSAIEAGSTAGFAINGVDVLDRSGVSVSSAGDVNGDGFDDIIVGAHLADPNGTSAAGTSYVIYGGATGANVALSDIEAGSTAGFAINGVDVSDSSGISVSSAGDVNGDGFDDIIVGAYLADPNGTSNAGTSYVIYGGATGANVALSAIEAGSTAGFAINGVDMSDFSGRSVSSAGDVNGDGFDDIIVGAYRADPNGTSYAGTSYVIYGGATGANLELSAIEAGSTAGFAINGVDLSDRSGRSVSSAGDVNGDGFDDIIVGAYGADPNGTSAAGTSYVIYGSATGANLELSDIEAGSTAGFAINGVDVSDFSGFSVSSAGDVNGDGFDDIIVGARLADPNGTSDAGTSYVIYGGATGTESTTAVAEVGTAAADNFTGNAGDDSFTGISLDDVVRGGAGDDSISITSLDFADVDGGNGTDTLVLDGAGLTLDLTGPRTDIEQFEVIDLNGSGANELTLDRLSVLDLSDDTSGGITTFRVMGGLDDAVSAGDFADWTAGGQVTEGSTTYDVFTNGNAELLIEDAINFSQVAAPD